MSAGAWQAWADASISHSDPLDPDVLVTVHELQKAGEVERLSRQHRLPSC